jgi:hypothetical protein
MNRCCICDYVEHYGSEYSGKEQKHSIIVRKAKDGSFYCSECSDEIYTCLLGYEDLEEEGAD